MKEVKLKNIIELTVLSGVDVQSAIVFWMNVYTTGEYERYKKYSHEIIPYITNGNKKKSFVRLTEFLRELNFKDCNLTT